MNLFRGLSAIIYKEVIHARRDSTAIMFALLMPLIQMTILGSAIDTNVRQLPTVVYDQNNSTDSRIFLDRLRNTDTFRIIRLVDSDQELNQELISGRAKVGVKIPVNYARRLLNGENAQILILVDGSDSAIAGQAVNVAAQVGLRESLARLGIDTQFSIEVRPKVMFNPASRSPNFFLPGLMAVLLLFVTTMLTAFSVVREKERGTLEQLLVTPVQPLALMLGKITPYFVLGLIEMGVILFFMRYIFQVPIHGDPLLMIILSTCYLFVNLTIGILISTKANSQAEAMQLAMMTILPSIFLSGYIFPRDNMPIFFQIISYLIPASYMINITRGVILRGAEFSYLWIDALVLFLMGIIILLLAARRFTRMIV